jgi:hypothetical protein
MSAAPDGFLENGRRLPQRDQCRPQRLWVPVIACGHLVKHARKGFAELQGSVMLQPQLPLFVKNKFIEVHPGGYFVCSRPDLAPPVPSAQTPLRLRHHYHQVVEFSHAALPLGWTSSPRIWTSVRSRHFRLNTCLRSCSSASHHIRVCACLAAQFAFFSRADSGVLLTAINAQATSSTFSINQSAINVIRIQAAPSSRLGVSSAQDDSGNCFNKLQLHWKTLCAHRDTDLYWSLADDSPSCLNVSGIITEWLLLLLVELNIPTLPGVNGLAPR